MWQRVFEKTVKGLATLAGLLLAFAMFLTTADVILRYFFHSPLSGVYEVVELLMGIISPIAILYCSWKKDHVSVEIVYNMLGKNMRKATLLFSLLCTLLVFGVLAWQGVYLLEEVWSAHLCTPILELPMWPAAFTIFFSFLLILPICGCELWVTLTKGEVQP